MVRDKDLWTSAWIAVDHNESPSHPPETRRPVINSTLETGLKNWVIGMERKKVRLSTALIKAKAHAFVKSLECGENFKFSNGWYGLVAKRNGFKEFKIHGESRDAQMEGIENRLAELKGKIVSYSPNYLQYG